MNLMDRDSERAAIDAFIASRGVTRCPDRYGATVDFAMSEAETKARLAAMPRPRRMTHKEYADIVYARVFPKGRKRIPAYSGKSPG
jgi:hypothetical protein